MYACLGSSFLHEKCGDEPLRAGAGRHDQWGVKGYLEHTNYCVIVGVEKRSDLLWWCLQADSEKVQGGWWGGIHQNHVQGIYHLLI